MSRAEGRDGADDASRFAPMASHEAAGYIADLTSELASLARGSRLDFLAYLLEIAQLEAAGVSKKPPRS